jgi:hypothetical protein
MTLPNGPLAVFGLPTLPELPTIKAAAAAFLAFTITRANDIFNMRINSLTPDALVSVASSTAADASQLQWFTDVSDGQTFCASLRVQRVYRGHRARISAHVRRNRLSAAAVQSAPLEPIISTADALHISHNVNAAAPVIDASLLQYSAHSAEDARLAQGSVLQAAGFGAVDDGDYTVPHPSGFIPPCVLCEAFDHSTREHPASGTAPIR